ncbi:RagB/SusD family nutrient uptake outer membrane protein [Sinomicrobium soli]|uniref:RagB/SusD family nutrient uptake outer membrane protein n=1 Tax=Sinomicrobium sp. N-1-3-6 TaxID=2219864 RepID=UPI000DCF2452|nr:RagB/SusD family nutrient uptake outer membrane protein [Sinomicrobium sp. N-1-3-6]RAV27637.1 RagB/SusD family nutrient uptake outer membrane protein [Sinomicrobium sp. N-1-3-6]
MNFVNHTRITKRIFSISVSACTGLLLMFLCSCSDSKLDENPKSVVEELFYNTREELEAAVNACYAPIRAEYAEQVAVLDAHTDWGYGRGSRANYNDFQGLNSANINTAATRWNAFYLSIRNANLLIRNAPQALEATEEEIALYIAEARFIRALNYFSLVRNWGGLPLRTEENMEEVDIARSSTAEVYDLILEDLEYAGDILPEEPRNIGRPTVYAVKSLLADVHLTLGNDAEAASEALEVIESGKYALVPATTAEDLQYNLFGPDIETSAEDIFSLKYTHEIDQGNWLVFVLNHPDTGLFNFGGSYAHYSEATNPFYEHWNDNDLRKALWDRIDFGLGPNTLVSKKYVDQQAVNNRGAGNDLPVYRFAEVLLIYAEASAREAGAPTPEGTEALNKVHRRAYGQDAETPGPFDFSAGDYNLGSFTELVLQERAYEFIFEGKRWYDLKRTGTAAETILEVKGITIAEKHYLWPIPDAELNFNGAMGPDDQNPGY